MNIAEGLKVYKRIFTVRDFYTYGHSAPAGHACRNYTGLCGWPVCYRDPLVVTQSVLQNSTELLWVGMTLALAKISSNVHFIFL